MLWDSQIICMKENETKVFCFNHFVLVTNCLIGPQYCMCCHDPTWLCPRCERLYINYLGKVHEENEWRKHFRTGRCDVPAQLKEGQGLRGRDKGKN